MADQVLRSIGSNPANMINQQPPMTDIEKEVIGIVRGERAAWEDASAFVTDRVAFQMRNLIRLLRKNYWGIFQEPIDPITGKQKIFIPLTETTVENCVKNIDLDTKDISFRAKNPKSTWLSRVVRAAVKNALDKSSFDGGITFGEKLDVMERDLAIDGTKVWKTLDKMDPKSRKKTLQILEPDLLNIYIDPTAPTIQRAYRFTERGLMFEDEVKAMSKYGWINTDNIIGTYGLAKIDPVLNGQQAAINGKGTKMVDVWECWGYFPRWIFDGKTKDPVKDMEEVQGHLIISGLEKPGGERVHLVETNPSGLKPYEEVWYTKVNGRWYGKGIAEKVMWLQQWINTIVNIRITRSFVSQLGIFKIKKGSGITPQMISRLAANGALPVKDMNDIEQFVMQEASEASYKDESNIYDWTQRVTNAYEAISGEALPSSTPATNAALQNQSAKSGFQMVKEQIGAFLERWLKRHALPIIMDGLDTTELVRMGEDIDDLRQMDEFAVNHLLAEQIQHATDQGIVLDEQQIMAEKAKAIAEYQKLGKERFVKLLDKIDITEYDVEVLITNEKIDTSVISSNLLAALKLAPQYQDQIVQQLFDIMGLNIQTKPTPPPQDPNQPQGQAQGQPGQGPSGPTGMPQGIGAGVPQTPSQNPTNPLTQAITQ